MKISTKIASVTIVGLLASSPFILSGAASADTKGHDETTTVAAVTSQAEEQSLIKTVDEAFVGLRKIRAARLAIFNGNTADATELVTDAEKSFSMARKDMEAYKVATKKSVGDLDAYIPFDTSISLSEGFVPTEEKASVLAKANDHLGKGDQKKAAETLRLANIDITVSTALIPIKATMNHVQDASKMLSEKKYYQANLALKAIEDSILVESYSVDEVPAQGS